LKFWWTSPRSKTGLESAGELLDRRLRHLDAVPVEVLDLFRMDGLAEEVGGRKEEEPVEKASTGRMEIKTFVLQDLRLPGA